MADALRRQENAILMENKKDMEKGPCQWFI